MAPENTPIGFFFVDYNLPKKKSPLPLPKKSPPQKARQKVTLAKYKPTAYLQRLLRGGQYSWIRRLRFFVVFTIDAIVGAH